MNKTVITLGFFIVILVGLVGLVLLLILVGSAAAATFGQSLITLLGIGTAGVAMIYGLGKQQAVLETIKVNTNGNLHAKEDENRRLTDIIIQAGIDPELAPAKGAHAV
jgi:uncharacterized protein YabE (DUF348 family)